MPACGGQDTDGLHLFACEVSYDMQIQADQSKCERNRLRLFICRLSSESIDNMLVNERWIAVRQSVAAQLVISVTLGHTWHRPNM